MSGDPWLELAENANTYTPLGPTDERIVTDRYVLWMGSGDEPGWNVAQRFRFEREELDDVRAEIPVCGSPARRSYEPVANNLIYLVYADGQPVARASAAFGERGATLFGGSTLPEARGRGAYR